MTREALFERFGAIPDAPGAITRLREIILEFAVRGRLSEQFPSDSSAEWKHFSQNADLRDQRQIVPLFEIPSSWHWVRLSGVGITKPRNDVTDSTPASFVPMALIPSAYGVRPESEERYWRDVKKSFTHLAEQDVVLAKITPCFENGKSAVMTNLINGIGAGTTELHVFRPDQKLILPEFALVFLKTRGFITRGKVRMTGSAGQKRVPHDYFANSPFPLPPLAEQKRIVAKVDELMALCDRLEALQKERETRHSALARASLVRFADTPTPTNFTFLFHKSYAIPPSELRRCILTLAVQGKLVPQDPGDQPSQGTFPRLAGAAVKSGGSVFPSRWLRVPLGDVGEWRGGGTPSKSRPEFWNGKLPWVSPKDMKVLHISDAQDHISKTAVDNSAVQLIPAGSLLMVVRGMILARAFPVAMTTREVTINQDMKALLPFAPQTKDYLLLALRALEPQILSAIERSSHGTCKLKTEFLHEFLIPLPPLAEQRRIVAKVEQLMTLVDQLETQLAASRATAAKLLDAIVAELTA